MINFNHISKPNLYKQLLAEHLEYLLSTFQISKAHQLLTAYQIDDEQLESFLNDNLPLPTPNTNDETLDNTEIVILDDTQSIEEIPPQSSDYIAIRKPKGADVYQDDDYIGFIPENVVRDFAIESGTILDISQPTLHSIHVNGVLDRSQEHEEQNITIFEHGIVEYNDDQILVVNRNASNTSFTDVHPFHKYYRIPSVLTTPDNQFYIQEGDIVTLAWENDEPAYISIRWLEPRNTESATIQSKTSKSKTKKTKSKILSTLDFDLANKTTAIVIGDGLRERELSQLIQEHNGIPRIIDGFHKTPQFYKENLTNTDIIVNVQNYSKHLTSDNIFDIARNNNIPIAISSNGGIQSIERAIYRALNNLPAYEPANSTIDYPLKTTL